MSLKLSPDLELPLDVVTQKFAILAKSGVGKTYTASVFTEEMLKAGMQVVVIDPTGAWYGLRSSADGKNPGLPIIVAGGEHADIPLEEGNAKTIANLIMEKKYSMVFDLSEFRKASQKRFVAAFLDELYHSNRSPIHIIIDEADLYAPQMVRGGEDPHVLGTMEDIVRRGRIKGIGVTLITQRPSVLNKDVLTQVDGLILLRLVGPQDRKAVDDWVNVNADREKRDRLMESLPSLAIGEAWFWAPGLDMFLRTKIRKRETLDSSSTPKLGEKRIEPTATADVDLEALRSALAETIEKVESEDPKVLHKRIAELEKRPTTERIVEKPVPMLTSLERRQVENVLEALQRLTPLVHRVLGLPAVPDHYKLSDITDEPETAQPEPVEREKPKTRPTGDLTDYARGLLTVFAERHPMEITRAQLAVMSGRRPRSSSFGAAITELLRADIIEPNDGKYRLTAQGQKLTGSVKMKPKSPAELVEMWRKSLPTYERTFLDALLKSPRGLTRDELAEKTGRSLTSSSFGAAITSLKRNKLIEVSGGVIRPSDELVGARR